MNLRTWTVSYDAYGHGTTVTAERVRVGQHGGLVFESRDPETRNYEIVYAIASGAWTELELAP